MPDPRRILAATLSATNRFSAIFRGGAVPGGCSLLHLAGQSRQPDRPVLP